MTKIIKLSEGFAYLINCQGDGMTTDLDGRGQNPEKERDRAVLKVFNSQG